MKIQKINEITFQTEETILNAVQSSETELVLLLSSGMVLRADMTTHKAKSLFEAEDDGNYTNGGFDITSPTSIYTLDQIVVVVNNLKVHGFIHYPGQFQKLMFAREDYYGDISSYPVALYKNQEGVPHLIYSEAWNHIQIMNLDTRQILTADKSLIEVDAEKRHIEFYKQYKEHDTHAWPTRYNYFFGKLKISPDQRYFASAGWIWGSADCYRIFDIETFLKEHRISGLQIGTWEHENRSWCWVNHNTIAVLYSPFMEGDEDTTTETPYEIHYYIIEDLQAQLSKKILLEHNPQVMNASMHYDSAWDVFIFVTDQKCQVISATGKNLLSEHGYAITNYNQETRTLLCINEKTIELYAIVHEQQ